MKDAYTVQRLTRAHLDAVAELELQCFAEPWSARALELLLGEEAFGFVCQTEAGVMAYGGVLVAVDEGQITNIAAHPTARRRGFGQAVLEALEAEARARGLCALSLEARVSNAPAVGLYEKLGFETVGRRRNFYRHPTEDALVMIKRL